MHLLKLVRIFLIIILYLDIGTCVVNAQCGSFISSFPYSEDFESGPAGWTSGGIANDWALGTPQKPTINSAGSGTQSWISGGLSISYYNGGERSWVKSPCFDFTNLLYPVISFKIFWELENQYDGGNLQYSLDEGNSWITIGTSSEINNCVNENWYTIRTVTNLNSFASPSSGWSGTIQSSAGSCRGGNGLGHWVDAKHCVSELAGKPSVIFRFTMGSGTTCNDYDGIAFDLFQITENLSMPFTLAYTCVGSNQFQFSESSVTCHDRWQWNFNDPASSSNTSDVASPIHTFSGGGSYTVSLNAGSACIPPFQTTISIDVLDITSETSVVTCDQGDDGTASVLVQNTPPGLLYSWNTIPVNSNPNVSNLKAGNYLVTVSASGYCDQILSLDVAYGPDAFPIVSLGTDTVLCPGIPIKITAGTFSSYEWQDGSTDSVFFTNIGGTITLRVLNASGCIASDTLEIMEDCLGDILFPNSFSPNLDGLNEVFKGEGNLITSFKITIFNRWGQQVFNSIDPINGWNGEANGVHADEGVYIYKAIYSVRNFEQKEKVGKLVLIR